LPPLESSSTTHADARAAVAEVPLWYHTMDLAPGLVTPGWFDLRPIVDLMPWPDVRDKRCLDIGTYDGFLAFELERRGAAEVVALDIGSHEQWDWPYRLTEGPDSLADLAGPEKGVGFRMAKEIYGSSVEKVTLNVYDLDLNALGGRFDVVVCGTLLLHLRDPLRALERIRTVCSGWFLSAEQIDLQLSLLRRGRPALRLDGVSDLVQWFIPNAAGHRRLLEAAGFALERWTKPYAVPFGAGHPPIGRDARAVATRAARALLTGGWGVPHQAVLASV
jgi:tRNA (mo5U34)-methyltransferase